MKQCLLLIVPFLNSCGVSNTSDVNYLTSTTIKQANVALPIKVLVAGQSNAGNRAIPDASEESDNPTVTMYDDYSKSWLTTKAHLSGLEDVGISGGVSAWKTFGLTLNQLTGKAIQLAGTSFGGMPITYWNVGGIAWQIMRDRIHFLGTLDYFVWWQGESDSPSATHEYDYLKVKTDYMYALSNLHERVKLEANSPNLKFVIVKISMKNKDLDDTPIRDAQVTYAAQTPNTLLVDADAAEFQPDLVHKTAKGYRQAGKIIAETIFNTNK